MVEGNYIYGNGIVGSGFQHNNYTAAIGITFQYNRFGPMRTGAGGNALKDRSAGLVVRYNWIEHGNRQLDLVDGEDSAQIRNDPAYRKTFVYGNLLIEPDGAGNNQITHYGGDSGNEPNYRKGTLYFYNNTIVSTRAGNTAMFRISTNDELCDARNNIFFNTANGSNLAMMAEQGNITLRNNWAKSSWINSHEGGSFGGTVTVASPFVTGTAPGFVDLAGQNFKLAAGAQAINAGTALHADALTANNVLRHYVKHQQSEARPSSGSLDLGAYEFATVAPVQITVVDFPPAVKGRFYRHQYQVSGGSGNYIWSVLGDLPLGLRLDPTTGVISGKLARKGSWTFQISVRDAADASNASSPVVATLNVGLYSGIVP